MPLLTGSSVFAGCGTTCLSNSTGCAQGKVLLLCTQLASGSHTSASPGHSICLCCHFPALSFTFQTWTIHLTLCRSGGKCSHPKGQWSIPAGEPKQRAGKNLCCLRYSSNWMAKAPGANHLLIFPLLLPLLFFPDCFTVCY